MRKILIAVPCMDQLPAQFAHSLATLTSYGIEDTQISIWFNLGSLIYTSRDQIAKKALLDEADLVMWFDSDMVFNPDTLKRLLKHIDDGADMVTGIYYRRTQPFSAVLFDKMDLDIDPKAMVSSLMKTEMFVSVFAKYGQMFTPIANCGEDIAFCWRARQCGYKILADPSVALGHVGHTVITKEFFDNYQSTLKRNAERG